MKITRIRPTTVTVPLEAPLRHSVGCHWGRFVRTIVEVDTDEGITGIGEMGGGGESADASFRALERYLVGHDPMCLEELFWKICNPTGSLYNNRTQMHAALEFACIDIVGKKLGVRACDLLGGPLRESVPFASYLFYRYENEKTGVGGEDTPEKLVRHLRELKQKHGFTSHKLKAGVFPLKYELEVFRAIADAFPEDRVRIDPNAAWSVEDAVWFGQRIEHLNNDYYEDPTFGMQGMRRVRELVRIPTATNTVIVNFEQLSVALANRPNIDVVLLDTTFWGGLRQAWKAGIVCDTARIGVAVHSSGELGIQLATMLHLGACLPNLTYAGDAHYHHLTDDIIVGGLMKYEGGRIAVPAGPGLGVTIDQEKLGKYAELYKQLGGYAYDRDPGRPDWYAVVPESRFAAVPASP